MRATLQFFGAAENVTGSSYLLEYEGYRLLVDCGLYQEREFHERNWDPFPVPPAGIDAVLLTHAHLDHCGLLPKLVREGFSGKIYGTSATMDIARIVLLDSAKIQEEDAAYKHKRHEKEGRRGPHEEVPLYTIEDAEQCLPHFAPIEYGESVRLSDRLTATFHDAGHILGSSMIEVGLHDGQTERKIVFSGDVGRWNTPILRDPTLIPEADVVLVESTYGNRTHEPADSIDGRLASVVNDTITSRGNILIPSFAIERTQELLYHLNGLLTSNRIPEITVFVDSPMAIRVTEVFRRHTRYFDREAVELLKSGDHPCDFPSLVLCRSVEESKAINEYDKPAIIIAGSGMCTGGRIKHHLIHNVDRPESTVLFVGYQARGTLGRYILEGHSPVRIFGSHRDMKAHVDKINGFSAHADRNELMRWLDGFRSAPQQVFVTHGEQDAAHAFAGLIRETHGWNTTVAKYRNTATLDL